MANPDLHEKRILPLVRRIAVIAAIIILSVFGIITILTYTINRELAAGNHPPILEINTNYITPDSSLYYPETPCIEYVFAGFKIVKYNYEYGRKDYQLKSLLFQPVEELSITAKQAKTIENYLELQETLLSGSQANAKTFCSMTVLGVEKEDENTLIVYAYNVSSGYSLENNSLISGEGGSVPTRITVTLEDGKITGIVTQVPRDGDYYPEDVKALFPEYVQKQVKTLDVSGTDEKILLNQIKALCYYSELSL